MKKHLILLLTLGALLNYRPGCAQANATGVSASVRTKPVSARVTPARTSVRPAVKTTGSRAKTSAKAPKNSVGRFWSRIMGICSEVQMAAKKKS